MSTKTIYKRIALIAVAALGAGVLSVAPASADYGDYIVSGSGDFAVGTQVGAVKTSATQSQVSGANNFVTFTTDNTAGVLTISGSTLNTAAVSGVSIAADKLSASQTATAITYTVPTKTAGTITVNFYLTTDGATSTTISDQLVITVVDAAQLLPSTANSTSLIDKDADGLDAAGKDDTVAVVGVGSTALAAAIDLVIKDGTASGGATINGVVLSAVVSGTGLIEDAATPGVARVATATTAGGGLATFNVYSDGTAGTGTITISAGTKVIATEKVTFSGAPTKVVATQGIKVTDGNTAAGAFTYTAGVGNGAVTLAVTDANGNPVTNVDGATYAVVAKSSDKTIMTETTGFASAGSADGKGNYTLQATAATTTAGKSASITYVVVDVTTEAVLATSAPITYAVGSASIGTLALSFDKASYAPGEKATLTLTAKDANGFAVADGGYDAFAAATAAYAGMTSSASLTTAPFSYAANSQTTFSGGVATATVFMPLTSGPITVTGKSVAGVAGVAGSTITATATVTSNTDISALTTLVNSLIAKINALNKLVIKIQKKVRA